MLLPMSSNAMPFVRGRINLSYDASSHLWTESKKTLITTYNTFHQDGVHTLVIPLSTVPRQILYSCIKQHWTVQHNFQIRCGVKCPPNVLSTSLRSKQTKIPQTMQCVPSNIAGFWWGSGPLPHSGISLLWLKLQLLWPWLQLHGALTYHSQAAQPCWPTCLSPILYLDALLRPIYLNLTAFLICEVGFNILVYMWYMGTNKDKCDNSKEGFCVDQGRYFINFWDTIWIFC